MRYAAYIRISSEEQVGNFSVDAQRRAIEAWVRACEGVLDLCGRGAVGTFCRPTRLSEDAP
jgi:DNA invertase Pin-like site-specific DNA recombinase